LNINIINLEQKKALAHMPKPVKILTVEEEAAEFSQKLLKISRGVDNFYEKTDLDGTVSLVFQTPAESIIIETHKLFPSLTKTPVTHTVPNFCHDHCKSDFVTFIETGKLNSHIQCSLENPPRYRIRDGYLEHCCLMGRVYRSVAAKPKEVESIRRQASEVFHSTLKIPVLDLSAGSTYIPILDQKSK
jgi:hypothetical protein